MILAANSKSRDDADSGADYEIGFRSKIYSRTVSRIGSGIGIGIGSGIFISDKALVAAFERTMLSRIFGARLCGRAMEEPI